MSERQNNERQNKLSTADLAGQRRRDDDRTVDPGYRDDLDAGARDDTAVRDDAPLRDGHGPHDGQATAEERAPDLTPEPMAREGGRPWGEHDLDRDPGEDQAPVASDSLTPPPATRGGSGTTVATTGPLLASGDAERFRARWTDTQTGFVDAPRRAVEEADKLVAALMQHLATTFADERAALEKQWGRGDDVSTDDLRIAFQRYRSFFERLLAN